MPIKTYPAHNMKSPSANTIWTCDVQRSSETKGWVAWLLLLTFLWTVTWYPWELSWIGKWWTYDTNRKQHCRTHHQQCGADHLLNNHHHHHNCEQSVLHASWSWRCWSSSQPPPLSLKRKYPPCIISALNISSQTCTCCAYLLSLIHIWRCRR